MTVLLVEPDEASSALISRGFSAAGVPVQPLTSLPECQRHIDGATLVLLVDRPRHLNGLAGLRAVREMAPDVPILFMTTFSSDRTRARAKQLGATAVVDQPCDLSELLEVSLGLLDQDEDDAQAG